MKKLLKMISGFRPPKKITLDDNTLRYQAVDILIKDERYTNLFKTIPKTAAIMKAESAITALMKEQAQLESELINNQAEKKQLLARILELSKDAFAEPAASVQIRYDQNGAEKTDPTAEKSEKARLEILTAEQRVRDINLRDSEIPDRRTEVGAEIGKANHALLESAVAYLYNSMKKSQSRVSALNELIETERERLKDHISERETLDASVTETYRFLHAFFGASYIDSIDEHYTDQ